MSPWQLLRLPWNHASSTDAYVTQVNFFVGQYDDLEDFINFPKPVTEKEAVHAIEAYLSTPLTKEFFDHGFDGFKDWTQFMSTENRNPIRGDLMGSNIFLEDLQKDGSVLQVFTGGTYCSPIAPS